MCNSCNDMRYKIAGVTSALRGTAQGSVVRVTWFFHFLFIFFIYFFIQLKHEAHTKTTKLHTTKNNRKNNKTKKGERSSAWKPYVWQARSNESVHI